MASAVSGDQGAAALLYRRYEKVVRVIAWRFAHSDSAFAEELIQEIWVHIYCVALAGWDPNRGSLGSFIARSANNKAIDGYRRQTGRRNMDDLEDLLETGQQFSDASAGPTRLLAIEGVRHCIDQMANPNHRQAIELFLNGWQYEEIAEIMSVKESSTIGTWIRRAKSDLRPCLEDSLAALYLKDGG